MRALVHFSYYLCTGNTMCTCALFDKYTCKHTHTHTHINAHAGMQAHTHALLHATHTQHAALTCIHPYINYTPRKLHNGRTGRKS